MALTNAQITEARRLIRKGMPKTNVAAALGCSYHTLTCGLDPGYRERSNDRKRNRNRAFHEGVEVHAPSRADVAARLAEIPEEDHRTITARLMGDPDPADRRWRAA